MMASPRSIVAAVVLGLLALLSSGGNSRSPGGSWWWRVGSAFGSSGGILQGVDAFHNTSISFSPNEVGQHAEIALHFIPTETIQAGRHMYLNLYGFTSGERNGTRGFAIGGLGDQSLQLYSPQNAFTGYYSEGSLYAGFGDSRLHIYPTKDLLTSVNYTIYIDRANRLQSLCGHKEDFGNFTWTLPFDKDRGPAVNYSIESVQPVTGECFLSDPWMTFVPQLPNRKTEVALSFRPPLDLVAGDEVTFAMPGFTNGGGEGVRGEDKSYGRIELDEGNSTFEAAWTEGEYEPGGRGFSASALSLRVRSDADAVDSAKADSHLEVVVTTANSLMTTCGFPENWTELTFSVAANNSDREWTVTRATLNYSEPIGAGCKELNYCSGQGECDYCRQRCNCLDGFGSNTDAAFLAGAQVDGGGGGSSISPDCSERMCPIGRVWQPRVGGSNPRVLPDESRLMGECSNVGTCIRSLGFCQCPDGYSGPACERAGCPNDCSGHGACKDIRLLARLDEALPLRRASNSTVYALSDSAGDVWDGRSVGACVCDSSWEVGLGSGQTQEAEYFAPDCSLRHCPSGDDPDTTDVDETDCFNVTAAGASTSGSSDRSGVGEVGNLCHVECSNRGMCDSSSGECRCFPGYSGQACQLRDVLAQ